MLSAYVGGTEAPGRGGTGLTWGGAPLAGATPGDGGPQGVGLHTIDRFLTRGRQAPGGGALTGSWLACASHLDGRRGERTRAEGSRRWTSRDWRAHAAQWRAQGQIHFLLHSI